MKFLCDNCKAKYQIADEKVAGKTVRMKCRKCGHMIEVRAAVTETSVAKEAPKDDAGAPATTATLGKAGQPAVPRPGGLATSLSATRPRASGPPPKPEAGSALAGAFQRQVQGKEARENDEALALTALDKLELSVTEEWYVAINGVPVGPVRIS